MTTAEQIQQYVDCLYESGDMVEWRAIGGDRKRTEQGWVSANALPARAQTLARLNSQGLNIYVGANPRKAAGLTGDANVPLCRALFVDFDHLDVGDGLSHDELACERIEKAGLPAPTLRVFSGHGIHAYWRLMEPMQSAYWTAIQERMILALDTDRVIKNPERIMRLAGFVNIKDAGKPVDCFVIEVDATRRYELAVIEAHLPQVLGPDPKPPTLTILRPDGYAERKARGVLYAAKCPGCSQGERNGTAFRHAAQMLRDFELSEADAWEIVASWNTRNDPPLDDGELRQAFNDAKKYGKGITGSKAASTKLPRQRAPLPDTTPPKDPASEAGSLIEAEIDGSFTNVEWPWPALTDLAQCLTPGARTLFVGGIGDQLRVFVLQRDPEPDCPGQYEHRDRSHGLPSGLRCRLEARDERCHGDHDVQAADHRRQRGLPR